MHLTVGGQCIEWNKGFPLAAVTQTSNVANRNDCDAACQTSSTCASATFEVATGKCMMTSNASFTAAYNQVKRANGMGTHHIFHKLCGECVKHKLQKGNLT